MRRCCQGKKQDNNLLQAGRLLFVAAFHPSDSCCPCQISNARYAEEKKGDSISGLVPGGLTEYLNIQHIWTSHKCAFRKADPGKQRGQQHNWCSSLHRRSVKHDSRATETPRLRDPSGILALLRIRIRIDFHFVTYICTTQGAESAPEHIYWRGTGQ